MFRNRGMLSTVMVVPITSTVRGAPSEVLVGVEHGLEGPAAINLDHVQTVRQSTVGRLVGTSSRDGCRVPH